MKISAGNNIRITNFCSQNTELKSEKERAPFFPETINLVEDVFNDYKNSLNDVSFGEVRDTALEVAQETQTPKKEVLNAMQLLTQFSNVKSLFKVSEALKKENLSFFGNNAQELCYSCIDYGFSRKNIERVCSETGIHKSLEYVLDKKMIAPFEFKPGPNIGLILDEEKISQLELVKQSQPKEFSRLIKDKSMKFFYISGWENGISIVDRTKNLAEKTKELLSIAKEKNLPPEKAIDYPYLDRIKELGIKPIVIKNENPSTEISVYNQMRPERMPNVNTLFNIIESNTMDKAESTNISIRAIFNHLSAEYLKNTLSVYTPKKMSKDLKTMHSKINDYAANIDKEPLYIIPNKSVKSSHFINYCYKKINNIDSSKFIYTDQLNNYFNSKNVDADKTILVFLDDCALSGNSMRDILSFDSDFKSVPNKVPILFANLKYSDEAFKNFSNPSSRNVDIIYLDKIHSKKIIDSPLEDIIGKPQYRENAYSLVLPYMAPDNNSQLATNIALLHNPKYNSSNCSSDLKRNIYKLLDIEQFSEADKGIYNRHHADRMKYSACTKNITEGVLAVSAIYKERIGFSPKVFTLKDSDSLDET